VEARRRGLKVWIAASIVLAAMALPLGQAAPAHAATGAGAITVQGASAQNSFPAAIQFAIRAQSSSQISMVRVAYRVGDDPVTHIANASYAPGFTVNATYAIDLQQNYLPPGVVLHYQWLIQDMSGAIVSTVFNDLQVTDPRFLWHQRTLDNVTLHWYDGGDDFADPVLSSASKAFTAAQQDALAPWHGPVQVYLYANPDDFRSALGVGSADWVGGETFSNQHVAMIFAPSNDTVAAQRSVSHELTHAAVDGASVDPFGPLPTWLDEGVAMVAEGDPLPDFTNALAKGVQARHLFSVQSLSANFPADSNDAILAYAESESLVRYFIKTYGRDHLAFLIAAFRAGNTADEAFQTTIGLNVADFQHAWQASLDPKLATPSTQPAAPTGSTASAVTNILSALVRDFLKLFQSSKASPA
jgi:hypothetical protein